MTNKLITLLLFLGALPFSSLQAYDYITVLNPQQQWNRDQGTIESAEFIIHPRGVYMEIGMYLTVSARQSYFEEEEGLNLETILDFNLPEGAIVHDSWLWIGDDIIQAEILDRWTAANIYEDIVGRNQDPSILYKQSATQYQLRIFPMEADSTRRVKVTYLMPADFSADHISVKLPIELLKTSRVPLDYIQVQAFLGNEWENPQFLQVPSSFEEVMHPTLGKSLLTEVPMNDLTSLDFALNSPMKEGVYLNKFEQNDENFYQLAFLPSEVFAVNQENPTKLAVLLDYVSGNSRTDSEDLLRETLSLLQRNLSDTDSFNIITSNPVMPLYQEEWVAATDENIKAAINSISATTLQAYSDLPGLFFDGVDFTKKSSTNASLLFVSNTDQYRDFETVNLWLDGIIQQMGEDIIPVHIFDYQDQNWQYHWIGNQNYIGNAYFYNNISRLTAGSYADVRSSGSFSTTGNEVLTAISALKGQLDIHTTLENGFCYSRYSNRQNDGLLPVNQVFTQIGKYQGEFPFVIEANGLIDDKIYSGSFALERNNTASEAEKTGVIWAGNHVNNLEKTEQTNQTVNEVIRYSLENRVLSRYTAFLALEVAQGGEVCETCVDGTITDEVDGGFDGGPEGPGGPPPPDGPQVVAVSDIIVDSLINIQASPNPFSEQTTLSVAIANSVDVQDIQFAIYDIRGKAIRRLEATPINENKLYQFTWNGTDANGQQLPKGMYLFNVRTSIGQKNLKLLYIE